MSSSAASKKSSSSSSSRKSALSSCWIRRLCPSIDFTPPPSHVTPTIPFHPKSHFPLPKHHLFVPHHHHHHHHHQEVEVVGPSEIVKGFGPFMVRPRQNPPPRRAEISSLFQHRRLVTGGLGKNKEEEEEEEEQGESQFPSNFRPALESIGPSPSQLPPFSARHGHASHVKDRDDHHPVAAARRNIYDPNVFGLSTARNLSERESHRLSSDRGEPFSYWNMGTLGRRNLVSSVYPATSSTITIGRKRAANTYGFFPSKFRRFCGED